MEESDKLFELIKNWAWEKGIIGQGNINTQYIKLQEEAGELARAILDNNKKEFIDAIGDCVVVLTNLALLGNRHFGRVPYEQDVDSVCNTCDGDGCYYEDVAGDGGSKMIQPCPDCEELNINLCINAAWQEIKNRTGKMQNGTFVKFNKNG